MATRSNTTPLPLAAVCCIIAALCATTDVAASGSISLVQTAQGTSDRLTQQPPLAWQPDTFASPSTVTIDRATRLQSIIGFGGAFTEAASYNFALLPAVQQEFVLDAYWGADGIGYTVGRVHIGRCVAWGRGVRGTKGGYCPHGAIALCTVPPCGAACGSGLARGAAVTCTLDVARTAAVGSRCACACVRALPAKPVPPAPVVTSAWAATTSTRL